MTDESIGSNNQGVGSGNVQGDFGFYTQNLPTQQSPISPFLNDSMSISEIETDQSNNMADPTNPRLKQPSYADIVMQFQLGMSQIVTDMLTQWNKSLQEESERIKQELNSPAYQSWLEQHSANYIAAQDAKAGKDLSVPTKDASEAQSTITTGTLQEKDRYTRLEERYYQLTGLSNLLATTIQNIENTRSSLSDPDNSSINLTRGPSGPDVAGYSAPAALAASLAIGYGFVSNFSLVPDVSSTSQVEVKTVQDAWNQINHQNDLATQTGGWFSAMWGIGLVYQLSAQNIAELGAGHEKGPHKDLEFAKGYAQQLLNSLDGDAFNMSLLALLTPMIEKSPEGKAQQNPELIAIKGKLVLLTMALALIYKLELKSKNPDAQIKEEDFAAMLKGTLDVSKDDTFGTAELKRQLIFQIQYNLQALPQSERAQLLENILAYVGKNPPVEDLLDQQKVFDETLAGGTEFQRSIFSQKPLNA